MTALPKPKRNRLEKLDAIRGFAACLVLLNHSGIARLGFLGSLGQEAVILFFLLSGFVIYYATFSRRDLRPTFKVYFIHRFRRIYPLLFIGLGISYASACYIKHRWLGADWRTLFGNIFMLQDVSVLKPGVWFNTYYENDALWSLSYEWWCYMLFFPISVMLIARQQIQKYLVFVISAGAFAVYRFHPNAPCLYLAYFFIWWTGVELAREYIATGTVYWKNQIVSVVLLGILTALWLIPVAFALKRHQHLLPGVDPVLQFRHFATSLLFLVLALVWHRAKFIGFRYTLQPFAIVAQATYAIYVVHLPILNFFGHLLHNYPPEIKFLIAIAPLFLIAYLMEMVLQPRINKLLNTRQTPR